MIALLSLACSDKIPQNETDLGYVVIDSGEHPEDTADAIDTAHPPEPTSNVTLYPDNTPLRIGAQVALRAVLNTSDQPPQQLTAHWMSSAPEIVQVEDQLAYALSSGTASLTAETAEGSYSIDITVIETDNITVHVFNPENLSPVEGMTVTRNSTIVGSTDSSGTFNVSAEDLQSISIYQHGYIPISLLSVPSSEIYLPAIPATETMKPMNETSGFIDFSGMTEPDFNEVSIALTIPEHRNILSVTLNDVFRNTRPVSIFGTEANIPSSVSLASYDESFAIFSQLDSPQLSTFAINTPISSLTEAANEADPFQLVAPLIPNMVFDTDSSHPQPRHDLYALQAPSIGNLPIEFPSSNILLFHGIAQADGHFETCGMAVAEALNPTLYTANSPDCSGANLFAAAIFDSENDTHRSSIVHSFQNSFPDFLDCPTLLSFDPSTKSTELALSNEAQITQLWIRAADGSQRIVYLPSHNHAFDLPTPPFPMGYGNTTWSIQQLQLTQGTYADWISKPNASFASALQNAQASGLIRFQLIQ